MPVEPATGKQRTSVEPHKRPLDARHGESSLSSSCGEFEKRYHRRRHDEHKRKLDEGKKFGWIGYVGGSGREAVQTSRKFAQTNIKCHHPSSMSLSSSHCHSHRIAVDRYEREGKA